ncbi:hypothetical protein NDU88_011112 [Pleurodeles waltl]|uniref:Uncharacterized protein n=1 Tax=Pleurodeles waltl TaxID=8319 RepID=A0AAV7QXP6_PLEWA|nr:hypothetical protein NDU88_011112 [Pleurodeles waltl]
MSALTSPLRHRQRRPISNMGSVLDQATSPRAGSRIPTAPSVGHSFTARGASPPLPQQAARPPTAPPVQALRHLLSLTRPTTATSRPHYRPHYTRSLVSATARSRRSASIFILQAQKAPKAQLHRSRVLLLTPPQTLLAAANNVATSRPPDQGTGESGARSDPTAERPPGMSVGQQVPSAGAAANTSST